MFELRQDPPCLSRRYRAAGVRKREVFGWAMYDFANSGYTTVVLTAVFGGAACCVTCLTAGPCTNGVRQGNIKHVCRPKCRFYPDPVRKRFRI